MSDLLYTIGADASNFNQNVKGLGQTASAASNQVSASLAAAGQSVDNLGGSAMSASMKFMQMRSGLSAMRDGTLAFAVGGQRADMMLMAMGHHITSLVNETGSMGGAFKALGASMGGVGGAILALTLLYEIYEKTTKKSKEATVDYATSLDSVRQATLKGQQDGQSEITRLQVLYQATQNHTLSLKDRNLAYDELERKYPQFFSNADREKTLLGENTTAYNALANAILAAAMAKAAEAKIGELGNRSLENNQKILDAKKEQAEAQKAVNEANRKALVGDTGGTSGVSGVGGGSAIAIGQQLSAQGRLNDAKKIENDLLTDNVKIAKQQADLAKLAADYEEKAGFKTGPEDSKKADKLKKEKDGFAILQEQISKVDKAFQDSTMADYANNEGRESEKTKELASQYEILTEKLIALKKAKDDAIEGDKQAGFIKKFGSLFPSNNKGDANDINAVIPDNKKADVGAKLNDNAKQLSDLDALYEQEGIQDKDYLAQKFWLQMNALNLEQSLYKSDSAQYAAYTNKKAALDLAYHDKAAKGTKDQISLLRTLQSTIGTGFKNAMEQALSGSQNFFTSMGQWLVKLVEQLIATIAEALVLATILSIVSGGTTSVISELMGGGTSGLAKGMGTLGSSFGMHAAGGIFTSPHVGMFGEAGPEAIVTPKHLQEFAGVSGQGSGGLKDGQIVGVLRGQDILLQHTRATKMKGRTS